MSVADYVWDEILNELRIKPDYYIALGKFDEALKLVNQALQEKCTDLHGNLDPHSINILRYKVNVLERMKTPEAIAELVKTCDKILEFYSGDSTAWNARGMAFLAMNNIDEAKASFKKATEMMQSNFAAWQNLGVVLSATGEYAEAIACFNRILEYSNPSDARAIEAKNRAIEAAKQNGIELPEQLLASPPPRVVTQGTGTMQPKHRGLFGGKKKK